MSQARRALEVVCFLSRSDESISVLLLTSQPQSCECGRRSIRFVRLALKVFMQNDRNFAGVILLYKYFEVTRDLLPINIICKNVTFFIVIVVRT